MSGEYILEAERIKKEFPGVLALKEVDFNIKPGEIHALLGENGAGKSTLIKIFSGVYKPESGRIIFNGEEIQLQSPQQAINLGISTIYQEFNLVPYMNVRENLFLGKEIVRVKKAGILNIKKMKEETRKLLEQLNLSVKPHTLTKKLGIAQQQLLEIGKAIFTDAKIIIMDEPSAVLTMEEFERLVELIDDLKEQGISIIYISHKINEIFRLADRVTVLRNGVLINTRDVKDVTEDDLVKMMVGRTLEEKYPKIELEPGEELLRVENLNRGKFLKDINFILKKGEILGITGMMGAGKTELARAIFGADRTDSGVIKIEGKKARIRSTAEAIKNKISYLPEDRKNGGLVLEMSVQHNISLSRLEQLVNYGIIDLGREKQIACEYTDRLKIKTPGIKRKTLYLSGGNQQKVVVAKWLFSRASIFMFDEPTRGIDVGVKVEVYELMMELVKEGAGVIFISSEFEEIIGISDRILVMNNGRIEEVLTGEGVNQENILKAAIK